MNVTTSPNLRARERVSACIMSIQQFPCWLSVSLCQAATCCRQALKKNHFMLYALNSALQTKHSKPASVKSIYSCCRHEILLSIGVQSCNGEGVGKESLTLCWSRLRGAGLYNTPFCMALFLCHNGLSYDP